MFSENAFAGPVGVRIKGRLFNVSLYGRVVPIRWYIRLGIMMYRRITGEVLPWGSYTWEFDPFEWIIEVDFGSPLFV